MGSEKKVAAASASNASRHDSGWDRQTCLSSETFSNRLAHAVFLTTGIQRGNS
jgi:hypothetical protein